METLLKESASCKSFHFMKDTYTKIKTLNALGQKHQVVHDHYSFWNLKTTGSLTEIQLFKTCPCENWGSLVSLASWSSTSIMSMLKLPNVSTTSTITFFSLPWITSGLTKPTKRNEQLSDGISIFALSLSFPRKLAILFFFFSSTNLYLPFLSGLYLNPNLFFFWIKAIGLSMRCNLFPNPFPARVSLSNTCFMPKWVISESLVQ